MTSKHFFLAALASILMTRPMIGAESQSGSSVKKIIRQFEKPSFGGYFVGKYDWNDRNGQSQNGGFDIRFMRLYLDGKCFNDFFYRLQLEACGAPGNDKGPRILDAFVEWQKYKFARIKLGQFKRPFTFENPYNPWNVGFGSYSQIVNKLSGMSDRTGEHSSGGRDLGLQVQGDLFPAAKNGHTWLHYQIGVFNGQGINHSDKDKYKDIIGGLWISPIKDLFIGGFGWSGKYTNENFKGEEGTQRQVNRKRWGVGLKYESNWSLRGEYVSSEGGSVNNTLAPSRSDGWYATIGVPVTAHLKMYGKWDCYRDNKKWNSLKTLWGLSANYTFCKNLMLQANYHFTHDKSVTIGKHYNTIDIQLYARF